MFFLNHFFNNPDSCILDVGLTEHCANSVNLPFSLKKYDVPETTYKVFAFIYEGNARKNFLELLSIELKRPILYDEPD